MRRAATLGMPQHERRVEPRDADVAQLASIQARLDVAELDEVAAEPAADE